MLVGLSLALVLLGAGTAEAQAPLERALASAERAAEAGRSRRAWSIWRTAAARFPDDARAAIRMAEALPSEPAALAGASPQTRARAAEAERALADHLAVAATPSAQARRMHAWAVAVRDHAGAIDALVALAGLQDADTAQMLARLAALAIHRDDLHAARRALGAAHLALPQHDGYLSDLGAIELALGDPSAAADHFARVLGRRPQELGARRDLAGALVAAGRAGEAVALLAQAVELHPEEPELAVELARAALEAGQPIVAERAARVAIEVLGDADPRGHSVLGSALAAQRRREDAEVAFAEALRRDPRDLRARQGLDTLRPAEEPEPDAGRRLAPP